MTTSDALLIKFCHAQGSMTATPLFSVVTPSYNQGRFIRATIESVLSQDYPNVEYIIMDGGSTDETASVVKDYASRLTFISEKDRGQTHAINSALTAQANRRRPSQVRSQSPPLRNIHRSSKATGNNKTSRMSLLQTKSGRNQRSAKQARRRTGRWTSLPPAHSSWSSSITQWIWWALKQVLPLPPTRRHFFEPLP